MALQFFAFIPHKNGKADESALEMLTAAKKIDAGASVTAVVTGNGGDLDAVCQELTGTFLAVWKIANVALAYPNGEAIRTALAAIVPADSILLLSHEHLAMDVAPGLSIKLNAAYVPDVVGIDGLDGTTLKLVRQEYNGQVSTHVVCDISGGAVISVRPGCFEAATGTGGGQVADKSSDAGDLSVARQYIETVGAQKGDVDITTSEILVAVGRGIEDQENLGMVEELAEAMGGDVACSRPIVDAKWLDKSRQVGTSGLTVKPKVYLALGISGSFQHLGGIKGNPFIVAVNKNPKAPIFQIADVGVVQNILEFIPKLTEKVKDLK